MAALENRLRNEALLHREIGVAEKADQTRVSDGGGLYLLLNVKGGGRAWRLDYTHGGKRKTLSLGTYPDIGLLAARQRRNDVRALLAAGKDPSTARKEKRKAAQAEVIVEKRISKGQALPGSFREVFEQWHETRSPGWSPTYAEKVAARIKNDVLPWLGDKPIGQIDEAALLECLRRVQERGAIESAHSTLQNCGQVFRFGIASGLCKRSPASGMSEALRPVTVKHMAATIDPEEFAALMVEVNRYRGSITTRSALMLLAVTFQRPYNVRAMRWADVDLDAALWSIPSAEMKRTKQQKASGRPHLVPLCPEAVEVLRELHPLTGRGEFVFVSGHTTQRPMSENTLNMALRRMGIEKSAQTSHGFRSSARTLLVERLGADEAIVEAQLAHPKSGPLGSAYDRTEFLDQRVEMMRLWGSVVSNCAQGEPFPKSAPAKASGAAPGGPRKAAPVNLKALAAAVGKLAGKPVSPATLRRALAEAGEPSEQ